MTNSTDQSKDKKNKPKGPIRTGLVIPISILVLLACLYTKYFFDSHVRKTLEWTITQLNGAEVNIRKFETSFVQGTMNLQGFEVTNKQKPAFNLFSFDELKWGFQWAEALKLKMIVDKAYLNGIKVGSKRSSPGEVLKVGEKSEGMKALDTYEEQILENTKERFKDNGLGDIASLLSGTKAGDQIDIVKENLQSDKKVKEYEDLVKNKELEWKKKIEDLPKEKEIKGLVTQAKKIKVDKKNPLTVLSSLNQYKKLYRQAKDTYKQIESASKDLKKDFKLIESLPSTIEKLIDEDFKSLQNRFQIPDANIGDLSAILIGKSFQETVAKARKGMKIAREYMPPPKTKEQKAAEEAKKLKPTKRGVGKTYTFPTAASLPKFLIKDLELSSKLSSDFSGNFSGKITNITSEPKVWKKPLQANFQGEFPKEKIKQVSGNILVDHTIENPREVVKIEIGHYPIKSKPFSQSEDLTFGLKSADGSAVIDALMEGENVTIALNNKFKAVDYMIDSKNKLVKEILLNTVKGIPVIGINAKASGTWDDLNWSFRSNLGRELAAGLKKEIKGKIAAKQKELKDKITEKVGKNKAKLQSSIDQFKAKYLGAINEKKKLVSNAEKDIKSKVDGAKKDQSNTGKEKLKDKAKNLLKSFKF